MKTIKLGNSQLEKSAVAMGIMRMVRLDSQVATKVLEVIHDKGINFIDSADIMAMGIQNEFSGRHLSNLVLNGKTSSSSLRVALSLIRKRALVN